MTTPDVFRLMKIIDALTEKMVDIPLDVLEQEAQKEGITNARETLRELEEQGLITTDGGRVRKIAKRLFW